VEPDARNMDKWVGVKLEELKGYWRIWKIRSSSFFFRSQNYRGKAMFTKHRTLIPLGSLASQVETSGCHAPMPSVTDRLVSL